MIPVVMLGINTSALPSLSLALFSLTVACPYFEYIPAIYLMTITLRAVERFTEQRDQVHMLLKNMLDVTQVAYMTFSLLINIFATSIIALKAWCVRVGSVLGKVFVDFALIDYMTYACIQEVPQVTVGKRDRCQNPHTGNRDIGSSGRVGYDLYSARCKLRLGVRAQVFTISLQVMSLASITTLLHFKLGDLCAIFLPVGVQLVVRNSF